MDTIARKNLKWKKFIEKATERYGSLFSYDESEYTKSSEKITVTCAKHGAFRIAPTVLLRLTYGCKGCSEENMHQNKIRNLTEFIARATEKHGDRFAYDKAVYKGVENPITIKCDVHGYVTQRAALHLIGRGCKKCTADDANERSTTETYIQDAVAVHGDRYDYSLTQYENTVTKVKIICKIHGLFEVLPADHLRTNCSKCYHESLRYSTDDFVARARLVHGDLYVYDQCRYTIMTENVTIICKQHGEFLQTPRNHLVGSGCQSCVKGRTSKKSMLWLEWMAVQTNQHIKHAGNGDEFLIPGSRFKADGYCADTNTVYEFMGSLWHSSKLFYTASEPHPFIKNKTHGEVYQKTVDRLQWIRDQGFVVEVMWEGRFDAMVKRAIKIQRAWRAFKGIVRQKKTRSDKGSRRATRG